MGKAFSIVRNQTTAAYVFAGMPVLRALADFVASLGPHGDNSDATKVGSPEGLQQ